MMKTLSIILGLAFIASACSEPKQNINYETNIDTTNVIDDRITDTTKVTVAELPVLFDSTNIMIYPVGFVNLEARGGYTKIGSYSRSNTDFAYSAGTNSIRGNFINLIFQDTSGNRTILSEFKKRINSAYYLESTFKTTRNQYLLYSIYDRDTNGDNLLTSNDLEALYISNIDGTNLKKLTKELHEFSDYKLINHGKILYFRTLEDINQDGRLNNKDKFHYYYLGLTDINNKVEEYNPLDVLMQ